MNWYARIETAADGIHLYELVAADTEAELVARADRVAELRAAHGIPENWVEDDQAGWDVSVIQGPLHPKLLAIATMHPLEG